MNNRQAGLTMRTLNINLRRGEPHPNPKYRGFEILTYQIWGKYPTQIMYFVFSVSLMILQNGGSSEFRRSTWQKVKYKLFWESLPVNFRPHSDQRQVQPFRLVMGHPEIMWHIFRGSAPLRCHVISRWSISASGCQKKYLDRGRQRSRRFPDSHFVVTFLHTTDEVSIMKVCTFFLFWVS